MYRDLNGYLRERFGEKVYKLALSGGMTCPNRDGTLGYNGCIFCSEGGSGEFAARPELSIKEQLKEAKARIRKKYKGHRYIAYFQSYTNTYGPVEYLRQIFTQAMEDPEVEVLSIATRPDCVEMPVIELLKELNQCKPIWVELGLQTIHPESATLIRRGYDLECFEQCVRRLKAAGIMVVVHVILGLPNESKQCMIETIEYLNHLGIHGIKLQLLHVLKGTDLERLYRAGKVSILSLEEYVDILADCIEHLSAEVVVHRLTGDGDKRLLVAPLWSGDKKRVWNTVQQEFTRRGICQGRLAERGRSGDSPYTT